MLQALPKVFHATVTSNTTPLHAVAVHVHCLFHNCWTLCAGHHVSDTELVSAVTANLNSAANACHEQELQGLALVETAGGPASPGPSGTLQVSHPCPFSAPGPPQYPPPPPIPPPGQTCSRLTCKAPGAQLPHVTDHYSAQMI